MTQILTRSKNSQKKKGKEGREKNEHVGSNILLKTLGSVQNSHLPAFQRLGLFHGGRGINATQGGKM